MTATENSKQEAANQSGNSNPGLSAIIVPAIASVIIALITSYFNSSWVVEDKVDTISSSGFEQRQVNTPHIAKRAGLVLVNLNANPSSRRVAAFGYLNDSKVASGMAHDTTNTISLTETSFMMPVPRDAVWKVETETPDRVRVQWFSPIPLASSD